MESVGPLQGFQYSSIVATIALIEYIVFVFMAGQARGRLGVPAPAITGNTAFERYLRIQSNSVEQLVVFLPAIFLFAGFVSDRIGAAVGLLFILGRALYARAYLTNPAKRGPGFGLTLLANLVLTGGGLVGAIVALF